MCGIAGIVKHSNSKVDSKTIGRIAQALLLGIARRGTDATGCYTSGKIWKAPVPASQFSLEGITWGPITLLHTRAATHGSPKNNANNHPLVSASGKFTLIHNGVLHCDPVPGYKYSSETDSEVLLSHIDTEESVKWGLECIKGSAATATLDNEDGTLYLHAWNNPIVVAWWADLKLFVFASTAPDIEDAYEAAYAPKKTPKVLGGLFTTYSSKELERGEYIVLGKGLGWTKTERVLPTADTYYSVGTEKWWDGDEPWGTVKGTSSKALARIRSFPSASAPVHKRTNLDKRLELFTPEELDKYCQSLCDKDEDGD